jgi:dihydrolipoyl dehydrogenase
MSERKDIAILGGGPGGYLAALRAIQLRKKVVIFEEDRIGGTCMNYGCIPTKALLHQTKFYRELKSRRTLTGPVAEIGYDWASIQAARKTAVDKLVTGIEFLLQRGKVELVKGRARLKDERHIVVETADGIKTYEAERTILATGSRSAALPFLQPDGRNVVTSREALEFGAVPASLIVIGAGAIGLEMAVIYDRLGVDVTVLEIMPQVLPGSDRETATRLERILKKQGLKVMTEMRIDEASIAAGRVSVKGVGLRTKAPFAFEAEKVLLATGRRPNSEDLGADGPAVELAKGGFVKVNAALETSLPGVYAVGDLIGGKLLAHKAFHDALVAVENASGLKRTVDYRALPLAVFTEPEFASVGLTEEEARADGRSVRVGHFPLQANGRALTMEATDGIVKVIADGEDRVIGAHILAPAAGEMIAVLTAAVAKGLTLREVGDLIYIHPTLSEAVGEAALKARNEALHLLNN